MKPNSLHRYFCHGCRREFDQPLFGRCPNPECRSYNWGDKNYFYAQQRAIADLKKKIQEQIQKKLAAAGEGKKKKKKGVSK